MLQNIIPTIDYPSAFSNWLSVFLNYSSQNRELAICGIHAVQYSSNIHALYLPHVLIAGSEKESMLPF